MGRRMRMRRTLRRLLRAAPATSRLRPWPQPRNDCGEDGGEAVAQRLLQQCRRCRRLSNEPPADGGILDEVGRAEAARWRFSAAEPDSDDHRRGFGGDGTASTWKVSLATGSKPSWNGYSNANNDNNIIQIKIQQ